MSNLYSVAMQEKSNDFIDPDQTIQGNSISSIIISNDVADPLYTEFRDGLMWIQVLPEGTGRIWVAYSGDADEVVWTWVEVSSVDDSEVDIASLIERLTAVETGKADTEHTHSEYLPTTGLAKDSNNIVTNGMSGSIGFNHDVSNALQFKVASGSTWAISLNGNDLAISQANLRWILWLDQDDGSATWHTKVTFNGVVALPDIPDLKAKIEELEGSGGEYHPDASFTRNGVDADLVNSEIFVCQAGSDKSLTLPVVVAYDATPAAGQVRHGKRLTIINNEGKTLTINQPAGQTIKWLTASGWGDGTSFTMSKNDVYELVAAGPARAGVGNSTYANGWFVISKRSAAV